MSLLVDYIVQIVFETHPCWAEPPKDTGHVTRDIFRPTQTDAGDQSPDTAGASAHRWDWVGPGRSLVVSPHPVPYRTNGIVFLLALSFDAL